MHAVVGKRRQIDVPTGDGVALRLAELADRLELKDGYAGEHMTAVSRLAIAVAAELGLGVEERRQLELGALLHDVGKLAVADRILTKPGPLDELERTASDAMPPRASLSSLI